MPEPLPPGSTIGILGGGQLGRMLSVAGSRLGLKTHIYNDESDGPAFDVAAASTVGRYDDAIVLSRFAKSVDVVTCEFENVPAEALRIAGEHAAVFPPAKSFAVAQDRLVEKEFVSGLGIAVAPYAAVESLGDLNEGLGKVDTPALLKTRRLGYDGKGQITIHTPCEAETAWESMDGAPCLVEGVVPFQREVSVIAVRGQDGVTRFYDVVENLHLG
ncbi:MAG: ATP-grasp domain-containing protein, partial [Alphaproteobacteria bacterium]